MLSKQTRYIHNVVTFKTGDKAKKFKFVHDFKSI